MSGLLMSVTFVYVRMRNDDDDDDDDDDGFLGSTEYPIASKIGFLPFLTDGDAYRDPITMA